MIASVALLLAAQQQGPWNNDLKLRLSDDKKPFGSEGTFVRAAGVPSLTRTSKGRLLAAFQWFPSDNQTAWDRVALSWSDDAGKKWSSPKSAVFKGLPEGYLRPFDPTVTLTEDGRIRMFFTSNTSGSRMLDDTTAIYSAISGDGETYTFEPGARFAVKGRRAIDAAVVKLGKTWHLVVPIGSPEEGAYHATSSDGLKFDRQADIPSVGRANWTGNLVTAGPGMCFYGCGESGLWWSYSTDGKKWTDPTYLNIMGGDPAVANGAKGRVVLLYVGTPNR